MKLIYHHITDAPIHLGSNAVFENTHIKEYGSFYGRFIFTSSTLLKLEAGAKNVVIRNSIFEGIGPGSTLLRIREGGL